ncbi:hypothetical protein AGABI2DRAFT_179996 [Agaricus bisporus var. bisporus H97]|uniref:hypothetical protein n=1 Tax=Agaricus bisporus var. bisporus (strain H97 / ATCC MYA-4626 / FGSC 10389) TaxID=936046 RepID=UPI00029F7EBA|nr:hypothetical protein AGABI2DRAFT_179996 [Agaricus bisporus var. bisporus H97]EKV44425.1 hypothetical protein AGABI2DRAFT_179996 [Agaricus bisporus var. bisporus H97]
MYSRLALFVLSACALGVVAADEPTTPPFIKCDIGEVYCCESIQGANSLVAHNLPSLLGLAAGASTGPVGVNCSDEVRDILNCATQIACCTGPSFRRDLTTGCSPIDANV